MDWVVPSASASERVLQCVAFAGFSCVVFWMILLSIFRRAVGLRPPRGRSFSIPAQRLVANRVRHLLSMIARKRGDPIAMRASAA